MTLEQLKEDFREWLEHCDESIPATRHDILVRVSDMLTTAYEAGRQSGVKTQKKRIWSEITAIADDYTGELNTHLDEIWVIIDLPPAIRTTFTQNSNRERVIPTKE